MTHQATIDSFLRFGPETFGLSSIERRLSAQQFDATRLLWETVRREVWSNTERPEIPRAAQQLDGLRFTSRDALLRVWGRPRFLLNTVLLAVTVDRHQLDVWGRRPEAETIQEFLTLYRGAIADVESMAIERSLVDNPASLTHPSQRGPHGTYGAAVAKA